MKKIITLMLAILLILSLAACSDKTDPTPSGGTTGPSASQQTDKPSENQSSGRTASTDYFYEKYDFTEEWMMPDNGVYTGYRYIDPSKNEAGNEALTFTVYDMTDEQIQSYIDKVMEHGYALLTGDTYSINTGSATASIQIAKQDDGSLNVTIDPSI